MGPYTNTVPRRKKPATPDEIDHFARTRRAEVAGERGRQLVDALFGRAALLPAWSEVLAAVVPAVQDVVEVVHQARHPESPGGRHVTADERRAIAATVAREVSEAVLDVLDSLPAGAQSTEPNESAPLDEPSPEADPEPPKKPRGGRGKR